MSFGKQQDCIHTLFEAQVARTPQSVALIYPSLAARHGLAAGGMVDTDAQRWTYQELNRHANQLAHRLQRMGLGPEQLAGICIERSPAMIVALLAVLKAGGAYVPLDPTYPRRRLAFMLEDAGATVLLTTAALKDKLPAVPQTITLDQITLGAPVTPDDTNPAGDARGENLAYVIYTSGSTGQPKGVEGLHCATLNRFRWMWQLYPFRAGELCCQKTSPSFVDSVWEIFGPLLQGVPALLLPDEIARDARRLLGALSAYEVTRLVLVPSLLQALLESDDDVAGRLPRLTHWTASGEALTPALAREFRRRFPAATLLNLYGSSEVAADATCYDTAAGLPGDSVPIGRPIANMSAHILDETLQPLPPYETGELYIGGPGLARGYHKRPYLTAARFIPDPFRDEPGARLFRTGDLARALPNGDLLFAGRADQQFKIRGYRIEPGEIEASLRRHPAVAEAVVSVREEAGGDKRLLAHVVQKAVQKAGNAATADQAAQAEQVSQWQMVWDETYRRESGGGDPAFNINGWNSSFTGLPIPRDEMSEWVNQTVARIRAVGSPPSPPKRVLEIGCGSGLLLFRLAPAAVQYDGCDISPQALQYLRQQLAQRADPLPHVNLIRQAADDFSGLERAAYDAVLLNSVVQYFPDVGYLLKVLEGAVAATAPGGFVFIGDVRSFPLLEALHASVQLHQAPATLSQAQLRQRVQRKVRQEEELVIAPPFFTALAGRFPAVSNVRVLLKRGRYHNELTRFRYDVVLHIGGEAAATPSRVLDWTEEHLSLPALRQRLHQQPDHLAVRGIPNARLQAETRIVAWLNSPDGAPAAGPLREKVLALPAEGIDPPALWQQGDEFGYATDVSWSGDGSDGRLDVLFRPAGSPLTLTPPVTAAKGHLIAGNGRGPDSWATNPLQARFRRQLVPALRQYLRETLPAYMVPAAFVLLEKLPLTPNGKIDRLNLPAPAALRPELERRYQPPRNPLEELLANVWAELLGLERVGIDDDFFELGGHSLMATQLLTRLRRILQVELPLARMFAAPTLGALAAELVAHEATPGQVMTTARLRLQLAKLSAADVQSLLQQRRRVRAG